jgi:hypothetical protein
MEGEEIVVFPQANTEGGVVTRHIPSPEEMEECEYARIAGVVCPRKRGERECVAGGNAPLIDCSSCPYHPWNIPLAS